MVKSARAECARDTTGTGLPARGYNSFRSAEVAEKEPVLPREGGRNIGGGDWTRGPPRMLLGGGGPA